jgi:acetaldehyde dehydrogenase
MPGFDDIAIVFDATSAGAHARHNAVLRSHSKQVVDLTPAAIGPYLVPAVNMHDLADQPNVNLVTCGGQATIPIVAAITRVVPAPYAEIVASIASRSAGPGTRANIDEFTRTTARGLEQVGGARKGKAIIVLNPADPPLIMRNTVFCLVEEGDAAAIERSVEQMAADVRAYVPGYHETAVQFERSPLRDHRIRRSSRRPEGLGVPRNRRRGHYLPKYAAPRHHDLGTPPGERLAASLPGPVLA